MRLKLLARPPCLVDVSSLTPDQLGWKSRAQVERLQLPGWNQTFAVGDLFRVSGDDPARMILDELDGGFIGVGAGMRSGQLDVVGNAGDYAGEALQGGMLRIAGNAGDFLGAGMRAGRIEVIGNAGEFAASARRGQVQGMRGGTIVVRGNVGERAGDRMRRGLLLVCGNAGSFCASRMLAGTIAVLGRLGPQPGWLMRRGTVIAGDASVAPLPTFNPNGTPELLAIRMLTEAIARMQPAFRPLVKARLARWVGDLAAEGLGELLIAGT